MNFPYYVKALYAGLMAFLSGLLSALLGIDEAAGLADITTAGWLIIGIATLAAIGGILGLQSAPANIATSVKPPVEPYPPSD